MIRPKLSSLHHRRFAPARKAPNRNRLAWRPHRPECLEDRLAPASNIITAGGLEFLASTSFEESGTKYVFPAGSSVSIGYEPEGQETFQPLVQFQIESNDYPDPDGTFSVDTDPSDLSFSVSEVKLSAIAVEGDQSVPIPIWQSTTNGRPVTFSITQLQSLSGVSLTSTFSGSIPIKVADCEFTLGTLSFGEPSDSNPGGQVQMQGTLDLSSIPLIGNGLTAEVSGTNYVDIGTSGVTLTGLSVTKQLPSNLYISGFSVGGTVTIGYANTAEGKDFTVSGGVTFANKASWSPLKNASAQLQMTVAVGSDDLTLLNLGVAVSGTFSTAGGLDVSVPQSQPLTFQYNAALNQFAGSGALNVDFNGNTATISLGSVSDPGLVIQNGTLMKFSGYVAADFSLFGTSVKVSTNGLAFNYISNNGAGQSEFEMYGNLSLSIPTGSKTPAVITAELGNADAPGLVIQGGSVTQVNIGLTTGTTFSVYGFALIVNGANVKWDAADDEFIISGTFAANFHVFETSVTLGKSPQTGLVIKDGNFDLQDAKFTLANLSMHAFTIKNLSVEWDETPAAAVPYTLTVAGDVVLPGGLKAVGGFQIKNGAINSIALTISSQTGIPIGDTGLYVTELGGSIDNLTDPANLVVTAHVAMIYGEKFSLLGNEVYLFRAVGDITVDASELVLGGTVQLGAYSTDSGSTWKAAAGSGDATLTLDWAEQIYDLHLDVNGFLTIFDISGDLTFKAGQEIDFLATATVVVPSQIPLIGGDTLGGLGFFFQHVFAHGNVPSSTTAAAWIDIQIIWPIEIGVEVQIDANGNVSTSVIGNDEIDNFGKTIQNQNQTYSYTVDVSSQIPSTASQLTYSVDWSKPAPGTSILGRPTFTVYHIVNGNTTTIPEDQFAANGIQLITDPTITTATSQGLVIVGSTDDPYQALEGDYQVVVTFTAQGGNPFPNFLRETPTTLADYPDQLEIDLTPAITPPSFGPMTTATAATPFAPTVPASPSGTFPVTLDGNMAPTLVPDAVVNVYVVRVGDPNQIPIPVGSATPTAATGGGVDWKTTVNVPITGLYPLEYKLYATVNDDVNAPVQSAFSKTFDPDFAINGNVTNQNGSALAGWTVFLDYNGTGQLAPNDPSVITNQSGFYDFPATSVPVGKPVDVVLVVPSADYVPVQDPIPVTYHGTALGVDFKVNQKSAITGTVFLNTGNNGIAADGTPVPGATVVLNPGGQTAVTDTSGGYTFNNLQPGTYTVQYQPPASAPVQAISDTKSMTAGPKYFEAGDAFTATSTIEITSLGIFDPYKPLRYNEQASLIVAGSKGVQLWESLATISFSPQDPGTRIGNFLYKPLPSPIFVYTGFQGIIATSATQAHGAYGPLLVDANNPMPPNSVTWTGNTNGGLIQFTGGWYWTNSVLQFPTREPGTAAIPFAVASFSFQPPPPVLSSPASGSHSVMIDSSGFDLSEHNDFGIQALDSVSGTIPPGEPRRPPTPVQGVVVNLLGRVSGFCCLALVASTTTDASGSYSFGGLAPGSYEIVPAGPTSPASISVSLAANQALTNQDFVYSPAAQAPPANVALAISPVVGSGDYTVSYEDGNIVVSDSLIGNVLYEPLTDLNSLTITAPDNRPVTLTIDESNGPFSLPGGIDFVGSASAANTVDVIAGPGEDSIALSGAGATVNSRSIVSWTNLDQLSATGGPSDDSFSASGDVGARGLVTLIGGPAANTYAIASLGANLAVVDATDRGTLDFSGASSGLTIDLRLAQGQPQAIGAGGNTLALSGLIANLTGTPYDDRIFGNDLDNVIHGLGGNDVIYGFGGNDLLDGGDGNDLIVGGAGNDILIGGAGNDTLIAGSGRDILIGGAGRDTLIAVDPSDGRGKRRGGSILIGGETAYDANDAALDAIMAEWASSRPRSARVRALLDGPGSKHRRNGSVFLNSKTIENDRARDRIIGDRHDLVLLGRGDELVNAPGRPLIKQIERKAMSAEIARSRASSLQHRHRSTHVSHLQKA